MRKKFIMMIGTMAIVLLTACADNKDTETDTGKITSYSEQDHKENTISKDIYVEENRESDLEQENINDKITDGDQASNIGEDHLQEDIPSTSEEEEYIDSSNLSLKDDKLIDKINRTKIADQSFNIKLNDWGEVTFVTCMPDNDENPLTDISVYLIKDEKILYHFPDIQENNISMSGVCEGISFVFFEDINHDNRDDIVIGALYESGAGPQGMITRTQVRIYEDLGDEFVYNKDLCDTINLELPQDAAAEQVRKMVLN